MIVALCFAVALSTAGLYAHGIKPIRNVWALLFLAYLPISIIFAAPPFVELVGVNVSNFWVWQPMFKFLAFALMIFVIASRKFEDCQVLMVLKVIVWCAFLTAIYCIFQSLHIDQFWEEPNTGQIVVGFTGHPMLTAPFLAMAVPLAIFLKDKLKTGVIIVGVVVCDSQIGWIGLAAGILFYLGTKNWKSMATAAAAGVILAVVAGTLCATVPAVKGKFNDHERFYHWKNIFKDWQGAMLPTEEAKKRVAENSGIPIEKVKFNSNQSFTGRGLGSFQFVYRIQHPGKPGTDHPSNGYHQAHNDPLELGYHTGWIGLALMLMAILTLYVSNKIMGNRYLRALAASLTVMLVCSTASFVFQIGTLIFTTCVIVGLLTNDKKHLRIQPCQL